MRVPEMLDKLLRRAPSSGKRKPRRRTPNIKPTHMGHKPGLNYDNIEALLDYGEGELHR